MPTESVCGMDVHEDDAAVTAEYEGRKYYFRTAECKDSFTLKPDERF